MGTIRMFGWVALGIGVALIGSFEALRAFPWSPFFPAQMLTCASLFYVLSSPRDREGLFRPAIGTGLWGLLGLVGIVIAFSLINQMIFIKLYPLPRTAWNFFDFYKQIYPDMVMKFGAMWADCLIFSILIFLAPIAEELFYRGLIWKRLRPSGRASAYIISSALFGLRHSLQLTYFWPAYPIFVGINYFVMAFCIGLLLARLFEKTGSLFPCMLAHLGINLLLYPVTILYFKGLITL